MKKLFFALGFLFIFSFSNLWARPKIALVLGGGGSKGLAEIPFVEAVFEEGIPIDMIVGTSFGSILGGMISAGYSPAEAGKFLTEVDYMSLMNQPVVKDEKLPPSAMKPSEDNYFSFAFSENGLWSAPGFLGDNNINLMMANYLSRVHNVEDFKDFEIPFYAVSTNALNGEPMVLDSGSISKAIRGSMSVPLVWQPFAINGTYVFDGWLRNCVPIRIAKELGADIVIAIDVMNDNILSVEDLSGVESAAIQFFMIMLGAQNEVEHPEADFLLCPELGDYYPFDFIHIDEFIEAGKNAVEERRAELHQFALSLQEQGIELSNKGADYEGSYKNLPDPVIEKIVVKDVSLLEEWPLPSEKEFAFLKGKVLDDEIKVLLCDKLNRLRDKYHLTSLYYYARPGSEKNKCILEIQANHFNKDFSKFFIGGENSVSVGKSESDEHVSFIPNVNLNAGVHFAGPWEMLLKLQVANPVSLSYSVYPEIFENSNALKLSGEGGFHFDYGSLSPETNLVNKKRLAAEDNGFGVNLGLRLSFLDIFQARLGAAYGNNWIHSTNDSIGFVSVYGETAYDTLENTYTSLNGIRFGLKGDFCIGKNPAYSASFEFANRLEAVRNVLGLGFDLSAGWSTKDLRLTESFFDYGGLYGLAGSPAGNFRQNYALAGMTVSCKAFEIAGMPLMFVGKVNAGYGNLKNLKGNFSAPDTGLSLHAAFKTPFGSFLAGGGWNSTGQWNMTLAFN